MSGPAPVPNLAAIDKSWTLFLDRDGVINEDKIGSYIFNPGEFVFMEGAPALFKKLSARFGRIIVVTNQRGVGRGLMSEADLQSIHRKMSDEVIAAGGKLDAIYYCTAVHNDDPRRKPNPGMAWEAQKEFPEIDFSRSIMAGNNLSDMAFGRNAGMYTAFIASTQPCPPDAPDKIDWCFPLLADFVKAL